MRRFLLSSLFILIVNPWPTSLRAQQYTIKFATLAPEGSTWMNVMKEYDQAIRKESDGRLGFKIYAGGVQGDDKDVLRKIKLGQLHSAGITGVGMTSIARKVRILDSPFLFRSNDESDHISAVFGKELNAAIEEGGYVNLGWAEVGFIYVYTNSPVRTPADMKNVKMWMWEGDPIAEAAFKAMNINPISLSITDVPTSLQTRLIDGVYTSPLAAIVLQWFTRVKYMLNVPLANASGAVVISKKKFDELPPDLKEILVRNGHIYMKKLTAASREANAKSLETLKQNGVTIVEPPSERDLLDYEDIGKRARRLLVGNLYTEDFLNRVEKELGDFRAAHPGGAK